MNGERRISVALFFSKEAREKRARQKEVDRKLDEERKERIRQGEQERIERIEKEKRQFCVWYSRQTQQFVSELAKKGFKPSWGFEVESNYNAQQGIGGSQYGNCFVFDVPPLEGLAFDMDSKQMLYFTCPTGYYKKFNYPDTKLEYTYVLIPFSDIFSANIEVNSRTTVSTSMSKQNVIGRSIVGGLIAGDAGAVIGGVTGNNQSVSQAETLPKKIVLNIQTTHVDYPVISFEFNKDFWEEGTVASDKSMVDTMHSIFSGGDELVGFREFQQKRKCDTSVDYHYYRSGKSDKNIDLQTAIDDIISIANLEIILKRVNKYAMKIEAIIQQCNKEIVDNSASGVNIVEELSKLVDMKEKGLITEEEFVKLKSKLIG